jgi:pulcherriminic acid synthase
MRSSEIDFDQLSEAELLDHIFSTDFSNDPYPAYRHIRDERPAWFVESMNGWWVSRHEDVTRVLKDGDLFTVDNYEWQMNPVHGRTILAMKGREHTQKRRLVLPFFHGDALENVFPPMIDSVATELIDRFRNRGHVEIVEEFSRDFPLGVIATMLGVVDEPTFEFRAFQDWADSIIAYSANFHGDEAVTADGLRARDEFSAFMLPTIAARRADHAERGDLLSKLLEAEYEGVSLSDEEIRSFCSLILTAGYETTDKLVVNTLVNLLDNPDVLAELYRERSLVERAVAETMRLQSPVHVLARDASQDVELHGQSIPAGSTIIIMTASANRDERVFDRPDDFDIERSDLDFARAFNAGANHAGFGLGRHFCVGADLGRLEATVAINHLLDAMPNMRYPDGYEPRYEGLFASSPGSRISTVRSVRHLPVEFDT